jgi:N-glycosidase YbiA
MIDSFSGEYEFLSNFSRSKVWLDDMAFPTVENAFQAAKTTKMKEREPFQTVAAGTSKRMGRRLSLRPDWETIKVDIMRNLLRQKFDIPELQEKLLATGNQRLVEGNWWNDRFWGVCRGEGQNMLGKLLMQIREEIRETDER